MSVWAKGPHEWWSARSTAELNERALERQRQGDAAKPNDMQNYADIHKRARGFVAEWLLHVWLREQGVAFTAHGGADPLPDIEIGPRRIAVRCQATQLTWQPHFFVQVFTRHLRYRAERVFLAYSEAIDTFHIVGGLGHDEFVDGAHPLEKGGRMLKYGNHGAPTGFIAVEPLYYRATSELLSPLEWLFPREDVKAAPDSVLHARCVAPGSSEHRASFWRLPGEHWVCGLCHPSPYPPEIVEAYSIGA